jgi:hypothetical protein
MLPVGAIVNSVLNEDHILCSPEYTIVDPMEKSARSNYDANDSVPTPSFRKTGTTIVGCICAASGSVVLGTQRSVLKQTVLPLSHTIMSLFGAGRVLSFTTRRCSSLIVFTRPFIGPNFVSLELGADTRATNGESVADKRCEKIHKLAPNIFACGAGTAADAEHLTQAVAVQLAALRLRRRLSQRPSPRRVVTVTRPSAGANATRDDAAVSAAAPAAPGLGPQVGAAVGAWGGEGAVVVDQLSRVAAAHCLLKKRLYAAQEGACSCSLIVGGVDELGPSLVQVPKVALLFPHFNTHTPLSDSRPLRLFPSSPSPPQSATSTPLLNCRYPHLRSTGAARRKRPRPLRPSGAVKWPRRLCSRCDTV